MAGNRKAGTMSLPEIVSRDEWLEARTALLAKEKRLTRLRDELNADRRRLPMVRVEKDYALTGPAGPATLLDLFEGRRQLVVNHFMFDPSWEAGCPGCTAGADEMSSGVLAHLSSRNTSFAMVSRAPIEVLEAYRDGRSWPQAWFSSHGTNFNDDFGATRAGAEVAGISCFLRDGDSVFHTYSTFARGTDALGGTYGFLDLTALGRQEEWEEPKGRVATPHGADPSFTGALG